MHSTRLIDLSQTALSEEHDLYFVAFAERIWVYEPAHDVKNHEPVQIVHTLQSADGVQGYLSRHRPHAINNILVVKLGTEEVLACVRDDGDCEVFMLRHILSAIENHRRNASADMLKLAFDHPIYRINVGSSAWGLSIHSEARMLAVSSNLHEITVIKFALVDQSENNGKPSKVRYKRDDPHGRWLASTDISGDCRFLDLQMGGIAQSVRFGRSFAEAGYGSYDRINAGWGIMFLDRRSFSLESSKRRALGQDHAEELPDARTDPATWDLSRTIRNLENTSDQFVRNTPTPLTSVPDFGSPGSDRLLGTDRIPGAVEPDVLIDMADDDTDSDTATSMADTSIVSTNSDADNNGDNLSRALSDADNDMYDDVEDEQTENTINPAMLYGGDRICGNKPRFQQATGICDDLPCPILHASLRNIYLLQPSRFKETGRHGIFAQPTVGFARPLRQYIQGQHRDLNMFDRINMHAYIPSLGVVIMASQKGRAVVLALTKVKVDTQTIYAMRAECILPFASQERSAEVNKPALRPFSPLHGIAVGPMPGCEGLRDEEKRWRLFLMYQDYTVLKYEIRRKDGQDAGVANVVI
ncbi:hypothetical protein LTR95_010610 [Oleoguttula sp. CCFEE 5521]